MKAANLLCKRLSAAVAGDGTAPLGVPLRAAEPGCAPFRPAFGLRGDRGRAQLPWDWSAAATRHIPVGAAGATEEEAEEGYGVTGVKGGAPVSGSLMGLGGGGGTNGGAVSPMPAPRPATGRTAVPPNASGPPGDDDGLAGQLDLRHGRPSFGHARRLSRLDIVPRQRYVDPISHRRQHGEDQQVLQEVHVRPP